MMRGVKDDNLEGLRKRITTLFFHYIKTPLFNPEVARHLKVLNFFLYSFLKIVRCATVNGRIFKVCFNTLLGIHVEDYLIVKSLLNDYFLYWWIKLTHLTSCMSVFPTLSSFLISEPNFQLNIALCCMYHDLSHLHAFACTAASTWNAVPLLHPASSNSFSKTPFTCPVSLRFYMYLVCVPLEYLSQL